MSKEAQKTMKHSHQVLITLMSLFLVSQILGLTIITLGSEVSTITPEDEDERIEVVFGNTTVGERPDIQGTQTIIAIVIGVFFGTIILLLLSKYNKVNIWKHWFFFATIITMSISLGVILNNYLISWILAAILGAIKVYRPNYIIHNITEIFIYPGIALLLVPLLNVFYAFILLVLISIYDAYAVWKSKHMITMAKFAKSSNLFPGLAVSYNNKTGKLVKQNKIITTESKESSKNKNKKNKSVRTGILGGGDIAFPLIFAATVLVFLLEQGYSTTTSIFYSSIISLFAGISLLLLFLYGKKDKYYPAMPYISAGCFAGYLLVLLLLNIF